LPRKLNLILLIVLLSGCASQTRYLSDKGVLADWARAKDLYTRERYYRAQKLLRDITLNYSGSAIIDSAYFYLARAGYELSDYIVAADDFRRLIQQFPSSKLAPDAAYYEALCHYELSPDFRLDQTTTEQAFGEFQRFLEDNPSHSLADSAYAHIAKCRDKLGHKQFAALQLYLKLEEYAAAVIYADVVLSDYYDTQWADQAGFDKIRALMKLKEYESAVSAVTDYRRRFPEGKFRARVDAIDKELASL
jgi:outer membrane protein assembly factor BamD